MDDVRHAAEERAARPKKSPVSSSFESERQREKNALVRQLDAQDGRNVHKISAAPEIPEGERVLRVAAYCRVSTDDIDQKLSIHLQIQQYMKRIKENPNWKYAGCYVDDGFSYMKRIKENPNWKYAGCYVDDGFSGTNTAHRQGFQKLMKPRFSFNRRNGLCFTERRTFPVSASSSPPLSPQLTVHFSRRRECSRPHRSFRSSSASRGPSGCEASPSYSSRSSRVRSPSRKRRGRARR